MRFRSTAADMPRGFYHRYTTMLEHLSARGLTPVSPPFAIYDNIDGNAADVEAGFVIEGDISGAGDMRVVELPGATVVALTHAGDYSKIEPSYFRLLEWMHELGLKRTGRYMEMYLNSPLESPDAELRTQIMAPVGPQSANDY
jgi:effector-binding domain-containing protein